MTTGSRIHFAAIPYHIQSIAGRMLHLIGEDGREVWVMGDHFLLREG